MIKNLQYLIFLFLIPFTVFSQEKLIKEEIEKACLIKIGEYTGTGLFYQDSLHLYLITAKHVIFDNKGKLLANTGNVISYPDNAVVNNPDTLQINFRALLSAKKLVVSDKSDITVAKIAQVKVIDDNRGTIKYFRGVIRPGKQNTWIKSFNENNFHLFSDIDLGEDVYVIGFPSAIGLKQAPQYDFQRPLLRKGIISGISPSFKTFLIDCHVYGGNSGGPVVLKRDVFDFSQPGKIIRVQTQKLIGVVSQFVPLQEVWENKNYHFNNVEIDNSGYAVIVPVDYAFDLIKSME